MIRGLGVDLVSVKRMEEAVARYGKRFLNRAFTPQEIAYCMRKKFPFPHLAGRWAVKEALFKAMGIGWGQGLRWQEVELEADGDALPQVVLKGRTKERAEAMGVGQVWASLSHEKEFAVAAVLLAEGREEKGNSLSGQEVRVR